MSACLITSRKIHETSQWWAVSFSYLLTIFLALFYLITKILLVPYRCRAKKEIQQNSYPKDHRILVMPAGSPRLNLHPLSNRLSLLRNGWLIEKGKELVRLIVEYTFCNIYLRCCLSALNEKTQQLYDYWYCSRTFHSNSYWSQCSILCKV